MADDIQNGGPMHAFFLDTLENRRLRYAHDNLAMSEKITRTGQTVLADTLDKLDPHIKLLMSGADPWPVQADTRTMSVYHNLNKPHDLPEIDMHNGMLVTEGHFFEPAIGTDHVGVPTRRYTLNGIYVGDTMPWLRGKRALVMIELDRPDRSYVQFDDWETYYSHGWWYFPTADFYLDINSYEDRM